MAALPLRISAVCLISLPELHLGWSFRIFDSASRFSLATAVKISCNYRFKIISLWGCLRFLWPAHGIQQLVSKLISLENYYKIFASSFSYSLLYHKLFSYFLNSHKLLCSSVCFGFALMHLHSTFPPASLSRINSWLTERSSWLT